MISPEEARTRVGRGAAHLDRVKPGWAQRVDLGTLTLHDPCACIVGQLCHSNEMRFGDDIRALFPPVVASFLPRAAYYGVDHNGCSDIGASGHGRHVYQLLQDAWIEAIADRLHAQPEATNAVDPVALTGQEVVRA